MKNHQNIDRLNRALEVYSDIVKFGEKSLAFSQREECIKVLEDFEEYEKCMDLHQIHPVERTQSKLKKNDSEFENRTEDRA
jgi:hypothetical protein